MIKLSIERVGRLLRTCRRPGAASRASERFYQLAQGADYWERAALLELSAAMNAHKHALHARTNERARREHETRRDNAIRRAISYAGERP